MAKSALAYFKQTICSFVFVTSLLIPISAFAEFQFSGVKIQKAINAVLAVMSYSAIPDLASSTLSISNASSNNPSIQLSQLGGGDYISKEFPLYLEGAIAYSRFDPVFIASDGTDTRTVPLKWNSVTLQGGLGWDFPIAEGWVIRPIFNFSIGEMVSDLGAVTWVVTTKEELNLDFLDGGDLTVGGLGSSLMFSYEHKEPAHDIDLQLRYSYIHLKSIGGSRSVQGDSDSSTANLYYRWRAPIDSWKVLDRPFRYVLEASYSKYFGDQEGVLGFDHLSSLGLGVELDSSAHKVIVTRTRLVGRYMFGVDVRGYSIGLAVSF